MFWVAGKDRKLCFEDFDKKWMLKVLTTKNRKYFNLRIRARSMPLIFKH